MANDYPEYSVSWKKIPSGKKKLKTMKVRVKIPAHQRNSPTDERAGQITEVPKAPARKKKVESLRTIIERRKQMMKKAGVSVD